MKATVSNGLSIDRYIPPHLRDMFYKNPDPKYKYAKRDGLDPYGFSLNGLALFLPLWALKVSGNGTFKSVDAYEHTCTQIGALWYPDSHWFDGSDDTITVPDHASLDMALHITLEIWVKFAEVVFPAAENLIGKGGLGAAGCNYALYTDTENDLWFGAALNEPAVWNSGEVILNVAQDTWYHICAVYDGSNFIGYKDGVAGTPVAKTGVMVPNATDLSIMGVGQFQKGWCGEVRIYNRALTAEEITLNRNCTIWRYQ